MKFATKFPGAMASMVWSREQFSFVLPCSNFPLLGEKKNPTSPAVLSKGIGQPSLSANSSPWTRKRSFSQFAPVIGLANPPSSGVKRSPQYFATCPEPQEFPSFCSVVFCRKKRGVFLQKKRRDDDFLGKTNKREADHLSAAVLCQSCWAT